MPRDVHCRGAVTTRFAAKRRAERNEPKGIHVAKPSSRARIPAAGWLALLGLSSALEGCSSPTKPPPPPSGGQSFVYSYDEFAANVEPILVRQGCDATGDCHGGGIRGTFALSPPGAKDVRYDFDQAVLQLSGANPPASRLLTQPLADTAGGTPHPYKPFASTADTSYQAMLKWVQDGVPQ
jgi:hypothetical protein